MSVNLSILSLNEVYFVEFSLFLSLICLLYGNLARFIEKYRVYEENFPFFCKIKINKLINNHFLWALLLFTYGVFPNFLLVECLSGDVPLRWEGKIAVESKFSMELSKEFKSFSSKEALIPVYFFLFAYLSNICWIFYVASSKTLPIFSVIWCCGPKCSVDWSLAFL